MLSVTKKFEFEACHHLPHYDGACHNMHGHSYKLEVTVCGEPIKDTNDHKCGMIVDFKDLKKIVKENVVDIYDHSCLDTFFDNPTAENMVITISHIIRDKLPKGVKLVSCKLWETSTSYAEYNLMQEELEYRLSYLERLVFGGRGALKYADNDTLRPAT